MANPRRSSYSNPINNLENPIQIQLQHSQSQSQNLWCLSLLHFLKKPHAFPFLLSIFLLLTWVSLRIQRSSEFSAHSSPLRKTRQQWSHVDDSQANLRRFSSGFPSHIAKDQRGWLINPISLALDSGLLGLFSASPYLFKEFEFKILLFWGIFCYKLEMLGHN